MKNKISKIRFVIISSIIFLLLDVIILAVEDRFYNLELNYDNGIIALIDVTVMPGLISSPIQPGIGYKLELFSFKGEMLYKIIFEIPLIINIDTIDPNTGQLSGREIKLNKTGFNLRIPYFKDGKQTNIYDKDNNLVLEIDVSHFAECRIKGYDCIEKEKKFPYWILISLILLMILLILFYFFYKKKKKKL